MAGIAAQVAAAQAALVAALEGTVADASCVFLGEPLSPPPEAVWVSIGYSADLSSADSSARLDRADVRLVIVASVSGVVDATGSATALHERLVELTTAAEDAVRGEPTLGHTVSSARVTRLTVSEQIEDTRLRLLAEVEVAAVIYGE